MYVVATPIAHHTSNYARGETDSYQETDVLVGLSFVDDAVHANRCQFHAAMN